MPILLFLAALSGWLHIESAQTPHYPPARRDTVVDDYHGVSVAAAFRYLHAALTLARPRRHIYARDEDSAGSQARQVELERSGAR
jgi:hypothetical protein